MTTDRGSKVPYIMSSDSVPSRPSTSSNVVSFKKPTKQTKKTLGQIITVCQAPISPSTALLTISSWNQIVNQLLCLLQQNCSQPIRFMAKFLHKGNCGKDAEDENNGHGNKEICLFPFPLLSSTYDYHPRIPYIWSPLQETLRFSSNSY